MATADDDPGEVAAHASRAWVILDAPAADRPWEPASEALAALRGADAELVLFEMRRDRSGRPDPG